MRRRDAVEFRAKIDRLIEELDEAQAADAVMLFPAWHAGRSYIAGDRVRYNGVLYRVVQAHVSQADWLPDKVAALYQKIEGGSGA